MNFSVPPKVEIQGWEESDNIIMGNFVVTVAGTEDTNEAVLVGAHYDVQNNLSHCWRGATGAYLVTSGADDNTSGTVGCLALLRRFSKAPPKKTTTIVLFDGEEPGAYIGMATGSKFFSKKLAQEKTTETIPYISCVIVDMIGGPPTVPKCGFVVSTSNMVDHVALTTKFGNELNSVKVTVANKDSHLNCLSLTDSVHFPKLGIPTVLLSNVGGFAFVPEFYHTENDTVDIINWETFLQALDILEFLVTKQLPIKQKESGKPNPDLVTYIMGIGFSKEQAEFALVAGKNNLEQALDILC